MHPWEACLKYKKKYKIEIVFSSCTFFTLISSKSAIAQCLKLQYYRELVPLIKLGPPQPLVKTLALLSCTKGYFEGVGEFFEKSWNKCSPKSARVEVEVEGNPVQ